jgi:hypothetical protein
LVVATGDRELRLWGFAGYCRLKLGKRRERISGREL